ncbi:Ig-like domain-containing protein [Flammeovirga aprica]|uniref:Choice-of-anchor D domain-containing protein n=1 Tax=Flammeovirga aprica JL-4 TaxID=694437 RepID=A0A7X9RZQ3_9BACT|nr:choice-of-anchor D domain-containing protein [Flammeovirga aprica]NME71762.1 choice-of-anchor D domain-containing protein [Flammeovirga aprica JL-4]
MIKQIFTFLFLSFLNITIPTSAQGILGLYRVNSDNSEEQLANNATLGFGNPGTSSSILSKQIVVRNESDTESLRIYDITFDKNGIFGYFPASDEMTIPPNQVGSFHIYYVASGNIEKHNGFIKFSTSDASKPSIFINAIVNKDDGELKLISNDYPIVNNQIDLGDIVIGETRRFTVEMENIGKGYMFVDKTEFESASNTIVSSYHKKEGFSSGTTFNNNFAFKATKKGAFEILVKNKLERGQVDVHQLKVIGNVLAPEAVLSYDGKVLQKENTIAELPKPFARQTFTFEVKNNGTSDLTINGVTLNQSDSREYHMTNSGSFKTIKPNEALNYTLELIPSSIGQKDIELIFNTTDPDLSAVKVNFSTVVEAALIRFEDKDGNEIVQNLGFDMTPTTDNAVVTEEIYIKNVGNKVMNITQFTEVYDIHNQFSFDYSGGDIGANQKQKITFTYSPNGKNTYKNSFPIDIVSNSHEYNNIRFSVHTFHQYHEAELRYNGNLVSESYPIDFGRFDINKGKEVKLIVKNSGTLPIRINQVSFKDGDQLNFNIKEYTQDEISAGSEGYVIVYSTSSKAHQYYEEILKVETSDYKQPVQTVKLTSNPVKSEFYMSNPENTITVWNGDIEEYGPLSYDRDFEYTYVIQNKGVAPLTLKAIDVEQNDGYTLEFSGLDLPLVLQPSEKTSLIMKANPHLPGVYDAKVKITTDEPGANDFSYTVRMNSLLPVLEVLHNNEVITPSTIDFSSIDNYTLTLLNRGSEILDLTSVRIEDNSEFKVEYDENIDFLRPTESLDLTIKYSPNDNAKTTAKFIVNTNDQKAVDFTLLLEERTVTSIDHQYSNVEVYPIPADQQLHIKGLSQKIEIQIYDLYGHKILDQFSNGTVDVSSLSAGIYLLEIDGKAVKKIFIK